VALSEAEIARITDREWWLCRTCSRGGHFRVVEIWVENRTLIEVLTPEMQLEYRSISSPGSWRAMLARSTGAVKASRAPVAELVQP
jgi:hypothetical protein